MPGKNPPIGRGGSERAWDLQAIQQLIDLLIERRITEFELEKGGLRIRIKRADSSSINPTASAHDVPPARSPASPPVSSSDAAVAPVPPAASPGAAAPSSAVESPEAHETLHIIKSPIVGTFYAAPAPNAPPFVKVSDVVQVGQVLCVIEAMKLMNEIESEVAGEIVRVYMENGQPVEYGQSLFGIKPSDKK
jgi:acetyl-CoA carboxylase biotin carboxyl carrier protein